MTRRALLIALAATFALTLGAPLASASNENPTAGRASVPKFALKDLKGKRVRLKDLEGKVVVISFWATWCVPCKQELDELQKFYKSYEGDDFEVLAISTDGPETASQIRGTVKKHKWKFKVLHDGEGQATSLLNPRGTTPYTMFVDRNGKLAYDHEGYSRGDAAKMVERIKKLLAEKKG